MFVKVRVTTGAKKESFAVLAQDKIAISIKQKPVENQANRKVVELLAKHFNIPQHNVHIINGHHAPSKLFKIDVPV